MMGGLSMGFGWIFWIFLAIAGLGLIKYFVDQNKNSSSRAVVKTPVDILKERYAKGEIDKAELEERKRELSGI